MLPRRRPRPIDPAVDPNANATNHTNALSRIVTMGTIQTNHSIHSFKKRNNHYHNPIIIGMMPLLIVWIMMMMMGVAAFVVPYPVTKNVNPDNTNNNIPCFLPQRHCPNELSRWNTIDSNRMPTLPLQRLPTVNNPTMLQSIRRRRGSSDRPNTKLFMRNDESNHPMMTKTIVKYKTIPNHQNNDTIDNKDNNDDLSDNDNYNNDDFSFIRKRQSSSSTTAPSPTTTNDDDSTYYDIGVSGVAFQTGRLSQQYYDTLVPHFSSTLDPILRQELHQMIWDRTTQDALLAICQQNGMELARAVVPDDSSIPAKDTMDGSRRRRPITVLGYPVDTIRIHHSHNDDDDDHDSPSNTNDNNMTISITEYSGPILFNDIIPVNNHDTMNDTGSNAGQWIPGRTYDFIVRNVPLRQKELSLPELLDALDPEGIYHQQAMEAGIVLPTLNTAMDATTTNNNNANAFAAGNLNDYEDELYDDDELFRSLQDIAKYNKIRSKESPTDIYESDDVAYRGTDAIPGYNIMDGGHLMNCSGSSNDDLMYPKILRHIMDSFVNHGCLVVDISNYHHDCNNGNDHTSHDNNDKLHAMNDKEELLPTTANGITPAAERISARQIMSDMWQTTQAFFDRMNTNNEYRNNLRPLQTVPSIYGIQSKSAKIGFASYNHESIQSLETRRIRYPNHYSTTNTSNSTNTTTTNENALLSLLEPKEAFVSDKEQKTLIDSFDLVTEIGTKIVQIAVAASMEEHDGSAKMVSSYYDAAQLLVHELMDDGKPFSVQSKLFQQHEQQENNPHDTESSICMSPHRLCRYSNNNNAESDTMESNETVLRYNEVFGAHTDTTFVTAIPVASVAGLEVYDERAERWFRPELAAKKHSSKQYDDDVITTNKVPSNMTTIPWNARYIVYMPGELLQIATRNEVLASVHRVVVASPQTMTPRTGTKTKKITDDTNISDTTAITTTIATSLISNSRLSAPILLRGRPRMIFDCHRYYGGSTTNSLLLQQCDGMTMEEIHDAIQ